MKTETEPVRDVQDPVHDCQEPGPNVKAMAAGFELLDRAATRRSEASRRCPDATDGTAAVAMENTPGMSVHSLAAGVIADLDQLHRLLFEATEISATAIKPVLKGIQKDLGLIQELSRPEPNREEESGD